MVFSGGILQIIDIFAVQRSPGQSTQKEKLWNLLSPGIVSISSGKGVREKIVSDL